MKLGLKEIGAVVALATAGCGQESEAVQTAPKTGVNKMEEVVDQRILDEFNGILFLVTQQFELGIRQICNQEANAKVSRLASEGIGFGRITDYAAAETEEACLDLHGLGETGQQ